MLRLMFVIGMFSLLSTCLGGVGPFGGEDPIRGTVLRYHHIGEYSEANEFFDLTMHTDAINAKGVSPYDCLYWVDLSVRKDDHPDIYSRLYYLNESEGLEGAYLEFKAITTMTDHPNEHMNITQLLDSRAAPAGKIWSNWYCEERNKAE